VIKNLETLYSINDQSQRSLLKNYKDMKSEGLLNELLHFLTLEAKKKILMSDYVVTTDNFIKLILIYLKTKTARLDF